MRFYVGDVVFNPPIDQGMKYRITAMALDQVQRRLERVNPGGLNGQLQDLAVDMPIAMRKVLEGYYTEKAAADFLANRIFKALLPYLGDKAPEARNEDILSRVQTHGAPEGFAKVGGPPITVDYLKQVGLTPKWSAEVNGIRYHMSDPFLMGTRVAFVAFVEQGGTVHTRIFYGSQSQAIWRAASHRMEGLGHLGMSSEWIGKGSPHEESTDLPWQLYPMLAEKAQNPRRDFEENTSKGIFYGLLEKITMEDFFKGKDKPTEDFYPHEATEIGSFGRMITYKTTKGEQKAGDPTTFRFNDPTDAPNFRNLIKQYSMPNSHYGGTVQGFVFGSHNGRLAWAIHKDQYGRAFVASIQDVESQITSRGAYRHIIDAGNLTMPAWEYTEQIPPDYRGQHHPSAPEYQDAWNYIRLLPFMGELYHTMGWA
jgi:hypothetical protein